MLFRSIESSSELAYPTVIKPTGNNNTGIYPTASIYPEYPAYSSWVGSPEYPASSRVPQPTGAPSGYPVHPERSSSKAHATTTHITSKYPIDSTVAGADMILSHLCGHMHYWSHHHHHHHRQDRVPQMRGGPQHDWCPGWLVHDGHCLQQLRAEANYCNTDQAGGSCHGISCCTAY